MRSSSHIHTCVHVADNECIRVVVLRSRLETDMARFKDVLGDGLRSHIHERQATGVEVVVHVLNRMFELGGPNSVSIV